MSSILAGAFGAHTAPLAVASIIFTVVAAIAASSLQDRRSQKLRIQALRQQELKFQQESKRELDMRGLDSDCAALVRGAEIAVDTILKFNAQIEERFRLPVDANKLRRDVELILSEAVKVTNTRAKITSIIIKSAPERETVSSADLGIDLAYGGAGEKAAGIQPGPMTAERIRPLQKVIDAKFKSVRSCVVNLEEAVSSVRTMESGYRDWLAAQEAERLNDEFRGMYASIEKDKLAAEELKRLAEEIARTVEAFQRSIEEIDQNTETLALPNDEESDSDDHDK